MFVSFALKIFTFYSRSLIFCNESPPPTIAPGSWVTEMAHPRLGGQALWESGRGLYPLSGSVWGGGREPPKTQQECREGPMSLPLSKALMTYSFLAFC